MYIYLYVYVYTYTYIYLYSGSVQGQLHGWVTLQLVLLVATFSREERVVGADLCEDRLVVGGGGLSQAGPSHRLLSLIQVEDA
jgi:hypothetical protein